MYNRTIWIMKMLSVLMIFVVSGCVNNDISSLINKMPEIQQYLKEHPDAKITVTFWQKEDIEHISQEINKQCERTIVPIPMYKVVINDKNLKIISWIDAENRTLICSFTEELPNSLTTPTIIPTSTIPIPTIVNPINSNKEIKITVKYLKNIKDYTAFEINVDTHRDYNDDFKNNSYLRDYNGIEYNAISYEANAGGHHANGIILFPRIESNNFELIIRNLIGIEEKIFKFDIMTTPIGYHEDKFRVGPTVRIRPVNDEIKKNQDGMIELYMDNPSLNDVMLNVDIRVSVPSGVHVYGEGFGDAGAAGMVYGKFEVPPGSTRTSNIVIKAEKIGDFSAQFSGLYWPGDNKDAYQPISLTHVFKVLESSNDDPRLTSEGGGY